MVNGDDKACAEASALIEGVRTAEVKKGLDLPSGKIPFHGTRPQADTGHSGGRGQKSQENKISPKAGTPVSIKNRTHLPDSDSPEQAGGEDDRGPHGGGKGKVF